MQLSNIEDRNFHKLPGHARYVASSAHCNGILEGKLSSDRQQLLDGKWNDIHSTTFDVMIQNLIGKIPPAAQDLRPLIPVSSFVHHFSYQMDHKTPLTYLYLSGSNTGYYVWLNGRFLGNHDLSYTPAEFDLSGIIVEGDNLLEILAMEWQDRSNIQEQSERNRTIMFPEVYLLSRPKQHIRDYAIGTRVLGYDANVSIHFFFHDKVIPASIYLLNEFGKTVATTKLGNDVDHTFFSHYAIFSVSEPQLWNPEKPYYYTLVVETANEVLTERVALRDLRVEDDCLYLNGRPITFQNSRTKALVG